MFCNTKYLCYLVTAFVAVSSSVLFADGVCSISQEPSGHYVINCNGDGLQVRYEDITNEVYIIQNCDELKSQLTSAISTVKQANNDVVNQADNAVDRCDEAIDLINHLIDYSAGIPEPYVVSELNSIRNKVNSAKASAHDASMSAYRAKSSLDSLQTKVDSIECGSCPENGGEGGSGDGSCCEPPDLSEIISLLNDIASDISDIRYSVYELDLDSFSQLKKFKELVMNQSGRDVSFVLGNASSFNSENSTVLGYLAYINYNMSVALPSLNNYFYRLTEQQVKPVHESLFAAQQSPLYFYEPAKYDSPDGSHNYYSYLTNFYVEVAFGKSNSSLTNWFVRVEALLAALVLSDNKSTNTVDSSYGDAQKTQLTQSLQALSGGPSTVLNQVNDVGQGIVQSITVIHNSLSKFSSPSSNVTIANVGDDVSISFESSEITYLVNACRCVTTLIWTFGGLWLLFIFVYWCFKQAYNLFVFCYSVCSSIFGGGGAK